MAIHLAAEIDNRRPVFSSITVGVRSVRLSNMSRLVSFLMDSTRLLYFSLNFFSLPNSATRILALGFTQLLTEMSTG
jgi:hypothetical protein